jgi:hypothetical protein
MRAADTLAKAACTDAAEMPEAAGATAAAPVLGATVKAATAAAAAVVFLRAAALCPGRLKK